MKNTLSLYYIILSCLFSINNKLHAKEKQETQYWVVVAYESRYENYRPILGSAVISNVVRTTCISFRESGKGVTNQFEEYYTAYYAKQRGFSGLVRAIAFRFDTWDEAERKRRQLIGDHNRNDNPLIIDRFSYLCDKY